MKHELARLTEQIGLTPSQFLQEASQFGNQSEAETEPAITQLSARVDGVETAFREFIQDSEVQSQMIASQEAIDRLSAELEAIKMTQKDDSTMVRARPQCRSSCCPTHTRHRTFLLRCITQN